MDNLSKGQSTLDAQAERLAGSDHETDAERFASLAKLSPIEYDRLREAEAKTLGIRTATLDQQVRAARSSDKESIDFDDIAPWPQPVAAGEVLTEIVTAIRKHIICPEETTVAAALWITMTWFMDVVQVAPLAVITAPEKRCGKSQLLFLMGRLVRRPLAASNITPAALFRAVDAWCPTLLVDEADAFMKDNDELRGILNCGHTRDSAYIVRVVGDEHIPKRFNVWGAKALAGIGHLADTIMDRAIVLELRRKLPGEEVMRLRHAEHGSFDRIAAKLARLALDQCDTLRRSRPALPAELNDRAQDNWEPLLAIAELAGGDWPKRAHRAALHLSGDHGDSAAAGNELLADIAEIFEAKNLIRISTTDLIQALCADDEKPWSTYNRGKEITPRQVAKKLSAYGVVSKTIRIGYETPKGYEFAQFEDAFARYLPKQADLSATPPQTNSHNGFSVADGRYVAATEQTPETLKPSPNKACGGVFDKLGGEAKSAWSRSRYDPDRAC